MIIIKKKEITWIGNIYEVRNALIERGKLILNWMYCKLKINSNSIWSSRNVGLPHYIQIFEIIHLTRTKNVLNLICYVMLVSFFPMHFQFLSDDNLGKYLQTRLFIHCNLSRLQINNSLLTWISGTNNACFHNHIYDHCVQMFLYHLFITPITIYIHLVF